MNHIILKRSSFLRFEDTLRKDDPEYKGSFQDRVQDEHGIKFFINYDVSVLPADICQRLHIQDGEYVTARVQFQDDTGTYINVEFDAKALSLDDVREKITRIWQACGCVYYDI